MTRIIALLLTVLLYTSAASGQWVDVPSVRQANGPGSLADIISRVGSPQTYMDSDLVTSAHECTHGINSDLRQRYGLGVGCFYVLDGKAAVLKEPPVTIGQVAAAVPQSDRGRSFNLYLVQSRRDWDRQPLYLLDELSAYLNGTEVALQLNNAERFRDSYESTVDFIGYSKALLRVIPPGYNSGPLKTVLNYQINRCLRLRELSIRRGWWKQNQ